MTRKTVKKSVTRRQENAALRRTAIINAALDEFAEKGFAAARMEDVAQRAAVAKGTIYLHFTDKDALFEAIVNQEIRPSIDALTALAARGGSLRDFVEETLLPLLSDLARTRRGAVLRMLLGEAERFPKLAEVYYSLVIGPALNSIRVLLQRANKRRDLAAPMLLQFPQLLVTLIPMTVIWTGLFERFEHLDVERMARAYFDLFLGGDRTKRGASFKETNKATRG